MLAALSGEHWPLFTAQPLGRGQIFTLTTPVPEIEQARRTPWNELWIADQYWWAFGILSASIRTLSGADQSAITFRAGELIRLSNDSSQWPSRWELYTPQPERVSAQAVEGLLSLGPFSQPGTYYLRGTMGVPVTRGFFREYSAADTALAAGRVVGWMNAWVLATITSPVVATMWKVRWDERGTAKSCIRY